MSDESNISTEVPKVGSHGTPFWIFVLTFVLVFLGVMLFDRKGGGASAVVYEPYFSEKFVKAVHPPAGDPAALRGAALYTAACQACHQATGLGATGVAPPLAGSEWVTGEGINRLTKIIYHGVQGPIEVKGQQWNLVMPPMGKQMAWSDSQMADLISFLRTNEEWGNAATKVTPEQVAKALEGIKDRATGWNSGELMALPETTE